MRYTPEIEEKIVAQIKAQPEREVILPDWAYWKGFDTPWVYVGGLPTPLPRVLYERVIEALPEGAGLSPRPGTHRRNVNPYLYLVTPSPRHRGYCAAGHIFTDADWNEKRQRFVCQVCRAERLLHTPSPADTNRAKTHCPRGHPLSGKNLVNLKNGKRRCRICHAETQARYAARKQKKS
jgi:hypothetical protein